MGLAIPLGRWVLREACRQARAWLDAGIAPPIVAVNVSALQLKTPGDRAGARRRAGGDAPAARADRARADRERAYGGSSRSTATSSPGCGRRASWSPSTTSARASPRWRTGAASPSTGSRSRRASSSWRGGPRTRRSSRPPSSLAKELKLGIVAEGVEDEDQLRLLTEWGCTVVYYFSRTPPGRRGHRAAPRRSRPPRAGDAPHLSGGSWFSMHAPSGGILAMPIARLTALLVSLLALTLPAPLAARAPPTKKPAPAATAAPAVTAEPVVNEAPPPKPELASGRRAPSRSTWATTSISISPRPMPTCGMPDRQEVDGGSSGNFQNDTLGGPGHRHEARLQVARHHRVRGLRLRQGRREARRRGDPQEHPRG